MKNDVLLLGNRVARSSVAVIDMMVQRGAIKGEELSSLGQLRDQCLQLIQLIEAAQNEDESTEESSDESVETPA